MAIIKGQNVKITYGGVDLGKCDVELETVDKIDQEPILGWSIKPGQPIEFTVEFKLKRTLNYLLMHRDIFGHNPPC